MNSTSRHFSQHDFSPATAFLQHVFSPLNAVRNLFSMCFSSGAPQSPDDTYCYKYGTFDSDLVTSEVNRIHPIATLPEFYQSDCHPETNIDSDSLLCSVSNPENPDCRFCGEGMHLRKFCPAKHSRCSFCRQAGHFPAVCEKQARMNNRSATRTSQLANVPNPSSPLSKSITKVKVNGHEVNALVDTGSTMTFINSELANRLGLVANPPRSVITLASSSNSTWTEGNVSVKLELEDFTYEQFPVQVLKNLCCDFLMGIDLFSQHKNLVIDYKGAKGDLKMAPVSNLQVQCNLSQANIDPPRLFSNLSADCHPVKCPSRVYSAPDKEFISSEVARLKKEGLVEPSDSPWRAQVLITTNPTSGKRRMVVDYSRTINKFTHQDAYPLPRLDEMALSVSRYKYYSTFDLRSAYHQISIPEEDRLYTAFEGDGQLLQFCVIPFGVTNGPPKFQRVMDERIQASKLNATFAYLDNITVCGSSKEEHDTNVQRFYEIVKEFNLTLNPEKTISCVTEVAMLGYLISYGQIKPDPERMAALLKMDVPDNLKALKRTLGLFAYYSKWIPRYSDAIKCLTGQTQFPLPEEAAKDFGLLKKSIADAVLICPNTTDTLLVETDASDFALSASLTQNGRPIAFFSRTLQSHERKHPSIEKEAAAIVEAVRKWKHWLTGRKFKLFTDQEAVSFVFDLRKHGKTKNDKILRWRIELSCYEFDIQFRPGVQNVTADCLSRAPAQCSAVHNLQGLKNIHEGLIHPGISRLGHFIRSRNLPYSMEDVKTVVSQCRVCAELKPRFYKPKNPPLIKATQPFERLAIDFKGPIPSATPNKYLLVVVDEFSRFPFAFPCRDMTSGIIMEHLSNLFSVFGLCGFVHSDNGPSLVSDELRSSLLSMGIGFSNSSVYNPRGNGQVERFNGTIWRSVELDLRTKGLQLPHWECVVPSVLHSLRTLVCTSTNQTPHERLFNYQRRTVSGHQLPSWLLKKGAVLCKRHVRRSKYDPWCDEVELIEANPCYAKIRHQSGKEQTVSLRDLAPLPSEEPTPTELDITVNTPPVNTSPTRTPEIHVPPPSHSIPSSAGRTPPDPVSQAGIVPPVAPPAESTPSEVPITEAYTPPPLRRSTRDQSSTQFYQSDDWRK